MVEAEFLAAIRSVRPWAGARQAGVVRLRGLEPEDRVCSNFLKQRVQSMEVEVEVEVESVMMAAAAMVSVNAAVMAMVIMVRFLKA